MRDCRILRGRIFWRAIRYMMLKILDGYKFFISPILPKSCRFYPSCSQYARLVVLYQNPLFIPAQILYRILRCSPLCEGGIDYPLVRIRFVPIFRGRSKIIVWFVPISKKIFCLKGWYIAIPVLGVNNE